MPNTEHSRHLPGPFHPFPNWELPVREIAQTVDSYRGEDLSPSTLIDLSSSTHRDVEEHIGRIGIISATFGAISGIDREHFDSTTTITSEISGAAKFGGIALVGLEIENGPAGVRWMSGLDMYFQFDSIDAARRTLLRIWLPSNWTQSVRFPLFARQVESN